MLTIRDLKKTVGGRTLFEHAAMQVNYGERVALVGPNGAGKSTLFSVILGHQTPDAGTVERDEWTMVGYLPQESEPAGNETVLDLATGRTGDVPMLEARLKELEAAGDVSSPAYLEAHAKHEALNNPQVEAKAKKMLAGLGYRTTDYTRPAREMSGGWIMRAHLARLLVMEPDLLLLDEPDQPPRSALVVVAAKLSENVLRRDPRDLARPGFHGRGGRERVRRGGPEAGELLGQLLRVPAPAPRPTTNNWSPRTRTSKRRSPTCRNSTNGSAGGVEGFAGAEQAQADRAHGEDRQARGAQETVPLPDPRAAARRTAGASGWKASTWPTASTSFTGD